MFAVMLLLCVMRWKALADMADPHIFYDYISGAKFSLVNSENALKLKITPFTSGDYSYSFSLIDGSTEIIKESKDAKFEFGNKKIGSQDIEVSFSYDVPENNETLRYKVRESFSPIEDSQPPVDPTPRPYPYPHSYDVPADSSKDKVSSSSGSCSLFFSALYDDDIDDDIDYDIDDDIDDDDDDNDDIDDDDFFHIVYIKAEFSATVEVRKVQDNVFVDIEED